MNTNVVDLLCDLVRIPSVNPMGRAVSGEEYLEYRVTDYLEQFFRRLGVEYLRQEVEPQRENIMAVLRGSRPSREGGELLVFEAHQDTVPVDGMSIPPWTPELRAGRVYGRGACDIKGGMACMLTAFARLAQERPASMPTLVMACSVNEEYGFSGATRMAQLWAEGTSDLVPRVPDAVIIAEPTQLNVVVAHKGVVRWRCHTRGLAAHSANPQRGENAIYHMAHVLLALEAYGRSLAARRERHPLLGAPSLSVGLISGGISVNTVPDTCTIEIDRRLLPDENPAEAVQHVAQLLHQRCPGVSLVHDETYLVSPGLSDQLNPRLAERLSALARQSGGPGERLGVPYGTDAPAFTQIGAPTVVFGPGSIEQAHTIDEWISVDQLETAAEIYYQFGRSGLCKEG